MQVVDPRYQLTAVSMEVPADWRFAGTIARDQGCHAAGPALKFTARSPDGAFGLSQLPGVQWSWASSPGLQRIMQQQGCAAVELHSAADFLVNLAVPMLRPGARVTDVGKLLPEGQAALATQLEQLRQQNAAMARQYGQPPQKLSLEGARIRVAFEQGGRQVEELFTAVVNCTESQLPALGNEPASVRRSCSSRSTVIATAPQGKLDEFLASARFLAVSKSVVYHPDWQAKVAADQQADFNRAQAAGNAAFQRTLQSGRDGNAALQRNAKQFDRDLRQRTDRVLANDRARTQAMSDSAHATALHSLDRQDFVNPATGAKIEASNRFHHQWISSDGQRLIQTDDHAFDPNGQVDPNQSWTELVPK